MTHNLDYPLASLITYFRTSKWNLLTKSPLKKELLRKDQSLKDFSSLHLNKAPKRLCEYCKKHIEGRPNKRFCSSNCRKRFSEPKRNARNSPTKRRENTELFDRAFKLSEALYSLPISERLGYMKELIDRAREHDDKQLRDILSNFYLLKANCSREPWLFYRRSWQNPTIAQAARNYCKRFWHSNVKDVVYGKTSDPDDGLID